MVTIMFFIFFILINGYNHVDMYVVVALMLK